MMSKVLVRGTKTPGLKADCLNKGFTAVFPGRRSIPKNSKGIYTPDEEFMCKRAVCYSETSLALNKFSILDPYSLSCLGSKAKEQCVWGVCGQIATRANELEEKNFILCYRKGKRFIAAALIEAGKAADGASLYVVRTDVNKENIRLALEVMKAERKDFSMKRMQHEMMKRRMDHATEEYMPPAEKLRRTESVGSEETNSSDEAETPIVTGSATPSPAESPNIVPQLVSFEEPKEEISEQQQKKKMADFLDDLPTFAYNEELLASPVQPVTCDFQKLYYDTFNLPYPDSPDCDCAPAQFSDELEDENPFFQSFYRMVEERKAEYSFF